MKTKTKAITGVILTVFLVSTVFIAFNIAPVFYSASSSTMAINVPEDFATIQAAIDAASSGDVVRVAAGTYLESIVMKDGVSVIGAGADVTTIQSGGTVVVGASDAVIKGFKITGGRVGIYANGVSKFWILDNDVTGFRGPSSSSTQGIIIVNSDQVCICGNEISDIVDDLWADARGIYVSSSNNTIISGNRIFDIVDNEWSSVFGIIDSNSINSTIVGNFIYDIRDTDWDSAFGIYEVGESATIEYNTLAFISETAWDSSFGIYNRGPNSVANNIVTYITADFWVGHAYGINNDIGTVDFNDVYNIRGIEGEFGTPISGPAGVNNIFLNPMFVDPGARDFHLQVGSPCLTASETGGEIGAYGAPNVCILPATIDIDPDTLNLKSKGKWVTGYIELFAGFSVADIDRSTILLDGLIPVDSKWIEQPLDSVIGDYDDDGIPDLMVKFDRQILIDYLEGQGVADGDAVTITVTGEVTGIAFVGTDTIRVLVK